MLVGDRAEEQKAPDLDPLGIGKSKEETSGVSGGANKPFSSLSKAERRRINMEQRLEFVERLKMYRFFTACLFYEDNIGRVEVRSDDGRLIEDTFRIPPYYKLLTTKTRDSIPTMVLQVSQQEKLEFFLKRVDLFYGEALWQQELGRTSVYLKEFANRCQAISWGNYLLVLTVNFFYLMFYVYDQKEDTYSFETSLQAVLVDALGSFQTILAYIAVAAYYLEYKTTMRLQVQELEQTGSDSAIAYGRHHGSMAYGNRQAATVRMPIVKSPSFIVQLAKNVKRSSKCARYSLYAMLEVVEFLNALSVDFDHMRNFVYSLVSVLSGYSPMLMSLLLLDVLNKNRSLQKVMDIFKNNQDTMVATIILNFIFLYIFSFIAFTFFRRDY